MPTILAEARGLSKDFPVKGKKGALLHGVSQVDLQVYEGETLALVGESGCGKSTLGRLLLGLLPPTEGQVLFDGQDLAQCAPKELRVLRRQMHSPGTGKTMLAQRMPSILPDLSFDEALEVTKIHSIAGLLPKDQPLILNRPFRSPHHTISSAGLSGGGSTPKPGELSLAHNGILFLDELPEFRRDSLEVLRQPLEDGNVTISRVNATLTYPCNIMLIASMNPCKCGYFGDSRRQCTCTPTQVNRYRSRISGPLLDRIDIQVEVSNVDYEDLNSTENSETSAEIKKRVNKTRKLQLERYKDYNIYSNSQLDAGMLKKFCPLGEEENAILRAAFDNLGLSARAHSRILKVARTIADLEGSENIKSEHIAEAIQYRSLDRKYFE